MFMDSSQEDPLAWTRNRSPILDSFAAQYADGKPFTGYDIAVCSSVTTNTGILIETIRTAGADSVVFTSAAPTYNEPAVIEALAEFENVTAFVESNMTHEALEQSRKELLRTRPDFIIEDGCVLTATLHAEFPDLGEQIVGAVEQTTIGVTRLRAMERQGVLRYPVYAANDTPMKHYFDNVHGTGETTLTGILSTTNTLFSGSTVVIVGYGYCGRGVARKARGMGARTIVTEVDPRKALEAVMDGHWVMPMEEAASLGDYFIAATGNVDVIRREHYEAMSDDVIVASAGTSSEISVRDLETIAIDSTTPRPGVTQYHLPDGRRINLLADAYVVNLAAPYSTGHPAEVMDMTFGAMFMGAYDMLVNKPDLEPGVHSIPDRLDRQVASKAIASMGVSIDELTDEQREYIEDWEHAQVRL